MRIEIRLSPIILGLLFAMTTAAAAQQPQRRPMPTLTSDDLRTTSSVPSAPPEAGKPADSIQAATAKGTTAAQKDSGDKQPDPAEHAWNEKLSKAREKVKELERRADQAELEVNRLRNFQFSAEPRDPGTNANLNTRIAELTEQARQLRAEAKAAQDEVEALLEEGAAKGYQVESLSPTTKTGAPNLEYYRSRYAELQRDLGDAQARAEVMQLRINALRFQINNNARTGDNFFLGRLRSELQEAENGLELARARSSAAAEQLEELSRQARAAGISPGELR